LIENGYYLKARIIKKSAIAHAPPHVREIWDYFLMEANHHDIKYNGTDIKRGQCIRTYEDIREALHWTVGWRKMRYSKANCETAMKWLKKHTMITTRKTTRGMFVTVCNYETYQEPKNYENHRRTTRKPTGEPQTDDTINKKGKKEKNENNIPYLQIVSFLNETLNASYKVTTPKTRELIKKLFKQGFTFDDFKIVIEKKHCAWKGTEWERYLRPDTLFGTKFESYLNETGTFNKDKKIGDYQ